MNLLILLLILIILIEFYLRSKITKKSKYGNIKRVPSLSLERFYRVHSNTGHSQNSEASKTLGWDLIKNSHINVEINVPYFEKKKVNYIINNVSSIKFRVFKKNSNRSNWFFGCSITYGHGLILKILLLIYFLKI